jgi:hypothetical protein
MLLILLNWLYIIFTAFGLGYAFSRFIKRSFHYDINTIDTIIFIGIVIATIYAQIFSLFYKVGLVANIVLIMVSCIIYIIYRRNLLQYLKAVKNNITPIKAAVVVIITLIWCYCTSRGYMHYDSDLYHAQSIRWIEEYGIVKGLGNIHVRFAYNSSFFALQALYSMKFLIGDSLHAVNGFIALLLSTEVIKLMDMPRKKCMDISDFARVGAFYYLTIIYSDIVSPATDYTIMCIVFYLVIKWLVLIEQGEKSYVPYSLICVACVYEVTVKLTAGVMLILLIKPAYMLIKEKKWKDIAAFILMGVITIVPWFARTIIISGYLLYPYPSIDIFNVDWKISAQKALTDAAEIKTWGRGLYDADLVDLKINEWFPNWFNTTLATTEKILIILNIICIVVFIAMAVIAVIKRLKLRDELLVLLAIMASYIFWQTQAPLLRYGYAYVLLNITIAVGILWKYIVGKHDKNVVVFTRMACALIVVLVAVKAISLIKYVYINAIQPYYITQKEYGEYDLASYEVNGVTFYYPAEGDRVGYDKFPAIPRKVDIIFRGDDVSDGFKTNNILEEE